MSRITIAYLLSFLTYLVFINNYISLIKKVRSVVPVTNNWAFYELSGYPGRKDAILQILL